MTHIDLIFHFFVSLPSGSICMPNFEFLALTVPEIWGGPKILKLGHVTPSWPYWYLICPFFVIALGVDLRAKFRVSSFNRSRDMVGVRKFQKWVTWAPGDPHWPNFSFFPLVPLGVHLRAKFRVSSCYRSRDTEGVPKFQNWVTWPIWTHWLNFSSFFVSVPRGKYACQISSF